MTKDEQIKSLVDALKGIRDDYFPCYGEDAILMREDASAALKMVSPQISENCYCCGFRIAKWNFKYEKMLCQSCSDTLERLEKYREKMSALLKVKA